MEKHTYLITKLFGYDITVNIPSVITTLITVLLTFVIVMFLTSRIKLRPDSKRQNAVELLAYFVSDNVIKGNVNWKKYGKGLWATALTIISLVAVANTIGVLIEVSYNEVVLCQLCNCGSNIYFLSCIISDCLYSFCRN